MPKPAARPRIVLATLPPAMVFNEDAFSGEATTWELTSLKMKFSSSAATYESQNTIDTLIGSLCSDEKDLKSINSSEKTKNGIIFTRLMLDAIRSCNLMNQSLAYIHEICDDTFFNIKHTTLIGIQLQHLSSKKYRH